MKIDTALKKEMGLGGGKEGRKIQIAPQRQEEDSCPQSKEKLES